MSFAAAEAFRWNGAAVHEPLGGLRAAAIDVWNGMLATGRSLTLGVGLMAIGTGVVLMASDSARKEAVLRLAAVLPQGAAAMVASVVVEPALALEAPPAQSITGWQPLNRPSAEPQQENITKYLARRYRVAEGAVRTLVEAAHKTGREMRVDPLLILGVMAIESSMNPFAQSSVGAQGLMQVMTRVHSDKFESHGGEEAALDPIANLKVGSEILGDLIRRGGSVERGLQLYVGAGNLPDDGGYAAKVLGEAARIRLAATGKVDAALASGLRADRPAVKPVAAVTSTSDLAPASSVPTSGSAGDPKPVS